MIIMRVSEADREILERALNVRQILDLQDVMRLLRSQVLPSEKIIRALNLRTVYLSK
jgi:hypothetical protein